MSPRYPGVGLESVATHVSLYGLHREEVSAAVRGWKNFDQRQRLYILSEVIRRWASRFDGDVVLPLAAGAVSIGSLSRFLRKVAEWCNECEPKIYGGTPARGSTDPKVLKQLQELEQILAAIELFNEFATGRLVYYPIDHEQPMADDNVGTDREPPDEETETYLRNVLETSLRSADAATQWDEAQKLEERLRELAIQSVGRLQLAMDTPVHARGGMGLAAIDSAVAREPIGSPATQIHQDMKQVLQDLQELAHGEDSKSVTPQMWGECVERLLACWAPWADKCFVLHGLGRHTKQSKKDSLERLVACVTQYAYVMQGVESFARDRFMHVVLCFGTIGTRMQTRLAEIDKVPNELPAGAEVEVQNKINELDRLVVDDGVLDRWRTHCGDKATRAGRAVDVIVTAGDGQEGPWQQGDKRRHLEEAGLLVGDVETRKRNLNDLLVDLQQIAVAVQIPHTRLAGKAMRHKHKGEKLHAAEGWLVNPLAAALAGEPVPAAESAAVGSAKRRPRAKAAKKAKTTTKKKRNK